MADRARTDLPQGNRVDDRRIARAIARWFARYARVLPWRTEPRDPWISLMSEIMLQQTQVARVAERFDAFVAQFPTPSAMADRSVDDVLALWSGLGYYRRARLLHACAVAIVERHGGNVPQGLDDLHELPGVGRYTAGAVASIAFGAAAPIVDGNVARVLLRVHGVERAPDSPGVQRWAWERAHALAQAAGDDVPRTNEGIMELGATVCTPSAPRCPYCPLRSRCRAFEHGLTERIPAPKTRAARKPLAISAVVVTDKRGRVLLEQRPTGGLWGGLWQPPSVERAGSRTIPLAGTLEALGLGSSVETPVDRGKFGFATTHRAVRVQVWVARAVHAGRTRADRGPRARWFEAADLASLGLGSAQRRMLSAGGVATNGPSPGKAADFTKA